MSYILRNDSGVPQYGTYGNALGSMFASVYANTQAAKASRQNSSSYRGSAALYSDYGSRMTAHGSALGEIGSRYADLAPMFSELAEGAKAAEIGKAARVQGLVEAAIVEAATDRREKIGSALTGFAANGVLIEGGQSAVAKWEADEHADFSREQTNIRQAGEDKIHELMMGAYDAAASIYGSQASMYGRAADMYGAAYQAHASAADSFRLSGENLRLADSADKAARKNKRMGAVKVVAGIAAVALAAYTGGASLAAFTALSTGAGLATA